MQQLQALREAREVVVGEREHLEAPRVVAQRRVVVGEAREVVGAAHGEPADVGGAELLDELSPDVQEAAPPRPEQPLLRAAREQVHVARARVEGARAEALDGVDDEPLAERAAARA